MTSKIHRVVQDTENFNCARCDAPIQHKVAASPTPPRDVQSPYTGLNLVACHAVWKVGAVVKRRER
jgi:hypothetical protein